MSRVDSVEISMKKQVNELAVQSWPLTHSFHLTMESDGKGVAAVIQPGGSKRDQEVIDACKVGYCDGLPDAVFQH